MADGILFFASLSCIRCVCVSFSLRQGLFVFEINPVDYPGFELTEICLFQPPACWEIKV